MWLQKCINIANDTNNILDDSLNNLYRQGEQFNIVTENMMHINKKNKETDGHLWRIGMAFGRNIDRVLQLVNIPPLVQSFIDHNVTEIDANDNIIDETIIFNNISEIDSLGLSVKNMKKRALDIGINLDIQLNALDGVTKQVNYANDKLKKHNNLIMHYKKK